MRLVSVIRSFSGPFSLASFVNGIALLLMLWYKPAHAAIIFLLPMLIVYVGTCYATYAHHSGLDTDEDLHASHNVVNPCYNLLSGNLGLHTAHHMKQALHWSKLPELHQSIEADIPPELISTEFPGIMGVILRFSRRLIGVPASV